MVRVVVLVTAMAALLTATSNAEASRGHKPKVDALPKIRMDTPRPHGHRGGSSYGGPTWSGSSYDHHKHRHPHG